MRKSGTMMKGSGSVVAGVRDEPSKEFVDAFVASMPLEYRGHDRAAIRAHAALVHGRKEGKVRIGVWQRLVGGGVAICVVAPDQRGLLSLIATALRHLDFDVLSAQVYTRPVSPSVSEAFDLFWIRRRGSVDVDREITDAEITRVEQLLDELIKNEERAGALMERAVAQSYNTATGQTSVFFEADQAGKAVLAVQTPDRPGLLLTISRTLFRQDAQVLHSEVKTESGRAMDRFHLADSDGSAPTPARRSAIARAVQTAIEDLQRKAG